MRKLAWLKVIGALVPVLSLQGGAGGEGGGAARGAEAGGAMADRERVARRLFPWGYERELRQCAGEILHHPVAWSAVREIAAAMHAPSTAAVSAAGVSPLFLAYLYLAGVEGAHLEQARLSDLRLHS